jgi:uncharacterized protein with WD repeat
MSENNSPPVPSNNEEAKNTAASPAVADRNGESPTEAAHGTPNSEPEVAPEKPQYTFRQRLVGYGIGIAVLLLPVLIIWLMFLRFTLSDPQEFTGFKGPVVAVALSPDGNYVAASSDDKTVRVWELGSGKEVWVMKEREVTTNSVAFSPGGDILLTGDAGDVFLWDFRAGKQVKKLGTPTNWVGVAKYSPDGKYIATAATQVETDNLIRLWDTATGKEIRKLDAHTKPVACLAFSPDGKALVSGAGTEVIVWQVETGKVLRKWAKAHERGVNAVAFSPSEPNIIASGGSDQVIRLRKVDQPEALKEYRGHVMAVEDIAFSPDGKYLASCSLGTPREEKEKQSAMPVETRTVRIWRIDMDIEWLQVVEFDVGIRSVVFSSDGKMLVGGGRDNKVYAWRMP